MTYLEKISNVNSNEQKKGSKQKMCEVMVSVIIPVYKTEEFLEECIDSVLQQDYPNLEIILVDDASPDGCPKICDRYAQLHEKVHVIHKKNEGVGIARNAGMDAAKGNYLMFLDSDDKLDGKSAVRVLADRAEQTKADIIAGGFRRLNESGVSEENLPRLHAGEYSRTVDFRFKGFFMYGHLAYTWGKLYRKEFLTAHDLRSGNSRFMQDKLFNMECCVYEPTYEFVDQSVVLYRINESSVTFKYKKDLMLLWRGIAEGFQTFLKSRKIEKDYTDLIAFHLFFGSFFLVKQELQTKGQGLKGAVRLLKEYGASPIVKQSMRALAKGAYVKQTDAAAWNLVIRAASLVFCVHAYRLYAAGIALLRTLEVDRRITKNRYKKQRMEK